MVKKHSSVTEKSVEKSRIEQLNPQAPQSQE